MLKKVITLIITTSMLSACVTGPDGYLKRSPLYNKKYISQAKKNILTNNLDEDMEEDKDDLYEDKNPSQENIGMYKAMIAADIERKNKRNKKSSWWDNNKKKAQSYPSVADAKDSIDPKIHAQNLELKEELEQIKAMLNETKKEMASYKCPTAQEQEKAIKNENQAKQPILDRTNIESSEQKTKEI